MGPVELAAILAPVLLPFARRAGAEARDRIASRAGSEAAGAVSDLWDRLRGRPEVAEPPPEESVASEESLGARIAEALAADPALLERARSTVEIVVQGERNVVQQGNTNINISGGNNINIGRLSD